MDYILRLPEVQKLVGLKRTAIYTRIKDGTFPKPLPLGTRNIGWLASEIESWIQSVAAERA